MIKNKDEQSQIISINIETNQQEELSPPINAVLRHPITDGDHIYFSTTVGILEQIVRLNVSTKEMDVMTDAPFRALDPLVSNDSLYYVSYEGIGYAIRKKELSAIESFKIEDPIIAFYGDLEKEKPSILKDIPTIKYKTSPYKRSTEFLQIHSWIPQFIPPNFGLTLLLQNKIGTFQGELTYVYNTNEGASQFSARLNYAQIYPKLFVGASHTLNRSANQLEFPFNNIPGTFYGRHWSETDFETGVILPFYLTRGKWHRFMSFEASAHYLLANLSEDVLSDTDLEFPYENTRLNFYNLKRRARRQINPQWGQSIVLDQSRSFDPSISTQFYLLSTFYFPGLFKTHSLSISPYYMYKPIDNQYDFLDAFPSSYGYVRYRAQNSYRILVKYTMPLWYPDLGIPGLAFFQRIFGSVFYDQSRFTWPDFPDIYQRSLGLELNLDMVVFRIYPLRIGVRSFYLLDPEDGQDPIGWEFLFFGFSF